MEKGVISCKLDSGQQTKAQVKAKIAQLDIIISSLYDTALVSVGNGDKIMYKIDTGQTKQEVEFSTTDSIVKAIAGYEKLRTMMEVKLHPRNVRLMDSKNFNGRW
jgi:hypothetical protein